MNHIPFITNMDNTKDKGIGKIEIKENGKYNVMNFDRAEVKVEGGSPTPTPTHLEKGDIITLAGSLYRVLKTGDTLEDVELMCLSTFKSSQFSATSPGTDPTRKTTFICGDEEKEGLKYEGSDLDTFCNETFLASLPEDVQNAIIEQEVVQEMYNTSASDDDFDIKMVNGGFTYRIKKASTESVVVGSRKIRSASVKDFYDYVGFDGTPKTLEENAWDLNKIFFDEATVVGTTKWLLDACSGGVGNACCVLGSYGYVNIDYYGDTYFVAPTFHINLTNIKFSK